LDVSPGISLTEPESHEALGSTPPATAGGDAGPFGWLPRVSHRQLGLERRLARWSAHGGLPASLDWLQKETGSPISLDRPEILARASGLRRAGLVAQLTVPRLATRLALGIEIPLAHAIVDRLLGFDRPFAESRLQLTPVEWGVWTFLVLRALDSLDSATVPLAQDRAEIPGLLGWADLTLDRVGPDPFDPSGLGSIVTVRWSVRVGPLLSAVRLWLPESVVSLLLAQPSSTAPTASIDSLARTLGSAQRGELASWWRALAGSVNMSQGLKRLRTGGVLPLASSLLTGTPASPSGPVDLILDMDGQDLRFRIPTRAVADSGGRLLRLESHPVREPRPSDPIAAKKSESKPMSQTHSSSNPPSTAPAASPLDVPVTLTVELGRVNMTLTQLADLKPGDVVELNRHSRAPVELTSNGRLVARGELILIDTDLGVRVTNVFL
jgi:type III secretion system YscQ/HrcQ family protein